VSDDEGADVDELDDDLDDDEDEPNGNLIEGADDDLDEDDDEDEGDHGNRVAAAAAKDVLDYLARAVVSDPDGVEIEVEEGSRGITLAVRVSDGDLGRVIGRRGRVANAIRTVVRAAAVNDGVDVDVDFRD
jgi:predicted RNA-binding protein YlqC (UPF0109 family)